MTTTTVLSSHTSLRSDYNFDLIVEEVKALLEKGVINRFQPLYVLANYIPSKEWLTVELELEEKGYLLRHQIKEILTQQAWDND